MSEHNKNLRLPINHYDPEDKGISEGEVPLTAPGGSISKVPEHRKEIINQVKLEKDRVPTPEQQKAFQSLSRLENDAIWTGGDYDELTKEELSQFSEVDGEEVRMRPFTPRLKESGEAMGRAFLSALRSVNETGRHLEIPLWNSGFRVTVGDFGSEEVFRLAGALKQERDQVGIRTNGTLYSVDDVHIITTIVDFILQHVLDCNLEGWDQNGLLARMLLVDDLQHLQAGTLDTMYPSGYPLHQECINILNDEKRCTYSTAPEEERRATIARFSFLRSAVKIDKRFGPQAVRHMAKNTVTEAEVVKYQEDQASNNTLTHLIGKYETQAGTISLIGKMPNYADYREQGNQWLARLIATVDDIVDLENHKSAKTEYRARQNTIIQRINQVIAQTQHMWIKRVTIQRKDAATNWTEDTETILESLAIISENKERGEQAREAIRDYAKSQISCFTAIPNFICPKCKQDQAARVDEDINLIPISMTAYFFTILMVRAAQSSSGKPRTA